MAKRYETLDNVPLEGLTRNVLFPQGMVKGQRVSLKKARKSQTALGEAFRRSEQKGEAQAVAATEKE